MSVAGTRWPTGEVISVRVTAVLLTAILAPGCGAGATPRDEPIAHERAPLVLPPPAGTVAAGPDPCEDTTLIVLTPELITESNLTLSDLASLQFYNSEAFLLSAVARAGSARTDSHRIVVRDNIRYEDYEIACLTAGKLVPGEQTHFPPRKLAISFDPGEEGIEFVLQTIGPARYVVDGPTVSLANVTWTVTYQGRLLEGYHGNKYAARPALLVGKERFEEVTRSRRRAQGNPF